MIGSDAATAIVTASRSIDREDLTELADRVRLELSQTIRPGTPLGLWVEDPINFAACAMGAMAARIEGIVISANAPAARALELCASEDGGQILCDPARAAELPGRPQQACGPGLVLVGPESGSSHADGGQGSLHFYTSGTDGRPKGVIRTKQSLALEEATVGPHLEMDAHTTVLCALPITHGYGYTAGVFAPIGLGGRSVIARPKLATSLAKLLERYEPDVVVAVPAQYAAWATKRQPYKGHLPRIWLCGGAPLPQAVRARFKASWGSVIAEQYGMTEIGAVTVDLDGAETLGRPYPGVDVSIDGSGTDGDVGEVLARAPYAPTGYIGDTTGAERFSDKGFRTGDNGWFDSVGRLHLVGRRAHQLNVRGQKLDPAEVERAFWALEGVQDVAVLGIDRTDGDQWIAAVVVCSHAITDVALRDATVHLEGYKRPQRVIRVSEIPKNSTGKPDFEALRVLARAHGAHGSAEAPS